MNLILFDNPIIRRNLLPFTFTRPVAQIRCGIFTIAEKWEKYLRVSASYATEIYLSKKFPITFTNDNLWINGAVCPDAELVADIQQLNPGDAIVKDDMILAVRTPSEVLPNKEHSFKVKNYTSPCTLIDQMWKIFQYNGAQIRSDFQIVIKATRSIGITDPYTHVYAEENIFIEAGARIYASVLNATTGPIYIGKNAEVQEGTVIRGPFALGENSTTNMGAKMRGDVSIGPHCKVGGEVSASVFFGYSNKSHDGFLGCSVVGEWCNFGADSNTSNLKNNYDNIKIWNYVKGDFINSGLMFCGLMMADHSKCSINTMFNTGTVAGVSANIFGDGFPRHFIPSFAWGATSEFTTYQFEKAMTTAAKAMERRGLILTEIDIEIYKTIFEMTAHERALKKTN